MRVFHDISFTRMVEVSIRQNRAGVMTGSLFLLSLINLLNYLDRYVMTAVSPVVEKDLGLSKFQVGSLMSLFMVGYMLASPIFGYLGDRRNRPRLMVWGVGIWSLATVGSGMARNFGLLVLSRMGVGVGEASYATVVPGYLRERAKDDHQANMALSVFYLAIPVGAALGYVWGGWGAVHLNWRLTFFLAGIPGILAAIALWFLPERRKDIEDGSSGVGGLFKGVWDSFAVTGTLMRMRGYRNVVLGYVAYTFAIGGFGAWAPNYCVSVFHAPLDKISFSLGIVTLASGIIGTLIGAKWGSRLVGRGFSSVGGFCRFSAIFTFAAGPFAFGMFLTPSVNLFVFCMFMVETLMFAAQAPINTAILASVPAVMTARAFAISILMIHALGDVISPALVGFVADVLPMPIEIRMPIAMNLLSGMVFVSGAIFWWQSRDRLGGDAPKNG